MVVANRGLILSLRDVILCGMFFSYFTKFSANDGFLSRSNSSKRNISVNGLIFIPGQVSGIVVRY